MPSTREEGEDFSEVDCNFSVKKLLRNVPKERREWEFELRVAQTLMTLQLEVLIKCRF